MTISIYIIYEVSMRTFIYFGSFRCISEGVSQSANTFRAGCLS